MTASLINICYLFDDTSSFVLLIIFTAAAAVLRVQVKTFFAVSYGFIVLTSVVFNSLVIFVVIVSSKLRTVTNMFFISLAISDLLIAVVNMPFQLLSVLRNEWTVGGEPLCKATNYVQGVVLVSSLLTLTGIAVDRCVRIVMVTMSGGR